MDCVQMVKAVESMIDKAAKSEKADDALKFSQAATNAANALSSLLANRRSLEKKFGESDAA